MEIEQSHTEKITVKLAAVLTIVLAGLIFVISQWSKTSQLNPETPEAITRHRMLAIKQHIIEFAEITHAAPSVDDIKQCSKDGWGQEISYSVSHDIVTLTSTGGKENIILQFPILTSSPDIKALESLVDSEAAALPQTPYKEETH